MSNPTVRLALRALVAGASVFIERVQGSADWNHALVSGALVAAALAAVEVFTPVNAIVGVGKTAPSP